MKNCYKKLHVITSVIINTIFLIITFLTNNPFLLFSIFIVLSIIFFTSNNISKQKTGLILFIPFSLVTILINIFFASEGSHILFIIGSRKITWEALLYALMLSFKLLIVIYIFQTLAIMLDSDRAVSYFSSVLPKSTMLLMISLKLFPIMKRRINRLKEIYSIRGLDFESKGIKKKLLSYIPVLSILLEDSLENSFDIGEAAYVRGFLSSKRSVYDRQSFEKIDFIFLITSAALFITYLTFYISGRDSYDFYALTTKAFLSSNIIIVILLIILVLILEILYLWRKAVVKNELY